MGHDRYAQLTCSTMRPLLSSGIGEPHRHAKVEPNRIDLEAGWEYFCQISVAATSDGSYSGVAPNEKIAWGELAMETPKFLIESDATTVALLLFACVLVADQDRYAPSHIQQQRVRRYEHRKRGRHQRTNARPRSATARA
jgi:hypothetical protein